MAKVFVFCIGGTGIRVMKSVTMLAAAGVRTNGYQIVPIVVDPHVSLEEKTVVDNLMADYRKIYTNLTASGANRLDPFDGFFNAEIKNLSELDGQNNGTAENQAEQRSFGEYINVDKLDSGDINNCLVKTLFSQANLRNSLSVGFKGNPNVGTVVLDEMVTNSGWYQSFLRNFQDGDRVFIISSIFGGTGASGYPLIEKKVRDAKSHPNVQNCIMGAVTVLPYYQLDDPANSGSDIDSSNFYTKTKAALSYYEKSVKSDYLYYVGEQELRASYKNNEAEQKDEANFVELVAATALFDFLEKAKPDSQQALTRAIRDDKDALDAESLGDGYTEIVKKIADMLLLDSVVKELKSDRQIPLRVNWRMNDSFYEDSPFRSLENFADRFAQWYDELARNRRSFSPFNLVDNKGDFSAWIKGKNLGCKDITYLLLSVVRESNSVSRKHGNLFRYYLEFIQRAINEYTDKITL